MSDLIFDLFVAQKSAKDIWSTLESRKGHKSYQCNQRKERPNQKPTPQANLKEQDDEVITVVVEVNLIKNNTNGILDTRASRYFYTNRELLHDYEDTVDGECVFMGNSTITEELGIWESVESGRVPHKRLDKTPYKLWKGHAPNLSYLKVWGCLAKEPFHALKKYAVGYKTFDCIFTGYAQNNAAYRSMHDPENPLVVSKTLVSETVNTSNVDEDPKTYQEALNSTESSMWKEVIKSELDSLIMSRTWDLVDLSMEIRTCYDASKHLKKNKGDSVSQPEYAKIIDIYVLEHATVKQLLKEETISLEFVRSEKDLADPLTKGLTRKVVLDSSVNMGLKPFGDP
ncbi:ty1-copia retrotransposon protein [Cucumis melo var. makuwa]|uniref:Ty1-copia retrotransposon protein n=1 Tax=Cucumis melo var. makuwa TaxID=1194695 RepID=A0A5A7UNZ6_CUCMM|nr:ty1-copia retrotransposon protein [Cucumis melo var. makuwa]TYJ99940.1 ty1-copia retrotransposon protein [Cucumis melo var. makuwa]